MSVTRRTFRVDFSQVPKRPAPSEAIKFMWTKIGVATKNIVRVQCKGGASSVFFQTKDPTSALRVVEENDGKHSFQCEGKDFIIPFIMDDNTVIVRLHDLSADVSDKAISVFLSQYGEVSAIREGVWGNQYPCKGLPDGNRFVTMVLSKPIPSYLTIQGEMTYVTYRGQVKTCKSCEKTVHHGMSCTTSRKLLKQTSVGERLTYAGALGPNSTENAPTYSVTTTPMPAPTLVRASTPVPAPTPVPASTPVPTTTPEPTSTPVPAPTNNQDIDSGSTEATRTPHFKSPLIPSTSFPSSASTAGKRRTKETHMTSDSDSSVSSVGGTIRRKPGRPPKHTRTEKTTVDINPLF